MSVEEKEQKEIEEFMKESDEKWKAMTPDQQWKTINDGLESMFMFDYMDKRAERFTTNPSWIHGYICGWKDKIKQMVARLRIERNYKMVRRYVENPQPYVIKHLAEDYRLSERQVRRIVRGK